MMPWVDPTDGSRDDDGRLSCYAQPISLDGFCSPTSTVSVPVSTPVIGVDDRSSPNSALQLIDYVPARVAECGPYGHLQPTRGDVYRAPTDPFTGDMYRAFSVPTLKSELV